MVIDDHSQISCGVDLGMRLIYRAYFTEAVHI